MGPGRTFSILILACLISLFAIPNPLHAQESLKINGFIQNYNAFQTTQENELLAGRNRLRFTLSRALPVGSATFESDIIHRYNDGDNDVEIRLREAYLEWFFDKSDLRIGLQNIIWGKTDAGFVTDILSPVDLREFLAVDINDIRLGVVSANFTRYFGSNFLQVIAAPAIQPDLIPQPDSRWFPVPSIASPIPVNFTTGIDRNTVDDVQGAVRYAMRSNIRFDLDFMAMYWTHPTPSYGLFLNIIDLQQGPNINLRETYNPSPMAGYSFEWRVDGSWIIKSEALYVQEKLFNYLPVSADLLEGALSNPLQAIQVLQQFEPRDDGFLIERPWLQTMLGVQTEISGFTISGQGYLETIFNFEDRILQRRIFPFTTGLIQKSFFRERLNLLSLTRYNIYADDFWVQFQGNYDVADGIEFALGTNLFGGPSPPPIFGHFTFNQFRQNSFVFARVTTYW